MSHRYHSPKSEPGPTMIIGAVLTLVGAGISVLWGRGNA